MPLLVPPLRNRPEDIPPLVRYFIERYGNQGTAPVKAITPAAMQRLMAYPWPGNIRQLRNVIQHACILARGECIEARDLPLLREAAVDAAAVKFTTSLADMERQLILNTLHDCGDNRTATALRLGITVRTLQNKLKRYRHSDGGVD
jgi:two-component system response regulator HydG